MQFYILEKEQSFSDLNNAIDPIKEEEECLESYEQQMQESETHSQDQLSVGNKKDSKDKIAFMKMKIKMKMGSQPEGTELSCTEGTSFEMCRDDILNLDMDDLITETRDMEDIATTGQSSHQVVAPDIVMITKMECEELQKDEMLDPLDVNCETKGNLNIYI